MLGSRHELVVVLFAAVVFLGTIVSPPSLMDDVDSTYAQIARTMLESGDWVTARINGVVYFDKPPAQVWAMAASFAVFGTSDWAARLPLALICIALAWATMRFGRWAFGADAGFWAGMVLSTCVGMWLFSRARIPDPAVALAVTTALYAAARLLEGDVRRPWLWSASIGVALGLGALFKGLPAPVFFIGTIGLALLTSGRVFDAQVWRRLRPLTAAIVFFAVAAPWHVVAILRNPPFFDFTLRSEPGVYRGFFWRYFVNEHVLRYLGLRFPKDYDTVPQVLYWPMHLLWLFPWSAALPAALLGGFRAGDRASRVRSLAVCWLGFVLVFFALSTSQEYYTMTAYPAFALLIGDGISRGGAWARRGLRGAGAVFGVALLAVVGLLAATAGIEPRGEITESLTANPEAYTLALGHMQDLTLRSFAWLRGPLVLAGAAFLLGLLSCFGPTKNYWLGVAAAMALFFHAARWAMVEFDPYLSSRPLAAALRAAPPGRLVLDDQYYSFSSLVFYSNQPVQLLNGRVNNIEYGSNAPAAPDVFVDEAELAEQWSGASAVYLATFRERLPELLRALQPAFVIRDSGGKVLLGNRPVPAP